MTKTSGRLSDWKLNTSSAAFKKKKTLLEHSVPQNTPTLSHVLIDSIIYIAIFSVEGTRKVLAVCFLFHNVRVIS